MKATLALSLRPSLNGAKRIPLGLVVAAIFLHPSTTAQITVPYGDAYNFAILAHTTITDAGGSQVVTASPSYEANVGVYPGSSITGLLPSQVPDGTIYRAGTGSDPLLISASNAASHAFDVAMGETPFTLEPAQLGGLTLVPGVYRLPDTATLTGTLWLDAHGVVDPVWIFQATSSLITAAGAPGAPGSSVSFLNAGVPCDVLWAVPTQATIGTYSDFVGTIIAGTSIVVNTGAELDGRAWALTGAVTLDHNTITGLPCTELNGDTGGTTPPAGVPDSGSTLLLLGTGLATLLGLGRWFRSLIF